MDPAFFWTIPCFCFPGTCHAGCLSGPGTCCTQDQALESWSRLLFELLLVKVLLQLKLFLLPHMPPSNLPSSRKPSLPPRLSRSHLFKAELVLYILCHITNHLAITYVEFLKTVFSSSLVMGDRNYFFLIPKASLMPSMKHTMA